MAISSEILDDIITNCDILLERLKSHTVTNDTAAGRMIYQCSWLKEQAQSGKLKFPIEDYVHTLKYVHSDHSLEYAASSKEKYREEIGIYIYKLLYLIDGKLLIKPPYYPYTMRTIDALIQLLEHAPRKLDHYELGFIGELKQLRKLLADGKIRPPISSYKNYPNSIEAEDSIQDIPNAREYFYDVTGLIFEGVRPDKWLTPEDADRETENLI